MNRWLGLTVSLWVLALMAPRPVAAGRNGEYKSWHANGHLAEVRHYLNGREEGLQQAWTKDGVLFVNYEMRNGRRYGLVNSKPCLPPDGSGKKVM